MSVTEEPEALRDEPLSWSWSSDLNHSVVIDPRSEDFYVRRWDYPYMKRFRLPSQPVGAQQLIEVFEGADPPRAPDVVSHLLRAFRQVRAALGEYDSIESVSVFLALLTGAETVHEGRVPEAIWKRCRTVGDLTELLRDAGAWRPEDLTRTALRVGLGHLPSLFLEPEPITGCLLDPSLLLRHAAGRLFQEASLLLEREGMQQLYFAALAADKKPKGTLARDVRFTRPPLARALAEESLNLALRGRARHGVLRILDPACGSGVFLQEALRELAARRFTGQVRLDGFDISRTSCLISEFSLRRAAAEAVASGVKAAVGLTNCDALAADWQSPDVILMNPPFAPWGRMSADERQSLQQVLGHAWAGQGDKAMGFVWRAVERIGPGKSVASIIPSSLLETKAGLRWRAGIGHRADISLVGRFRGYGYFRSSLVEPAFVVLIGRDEASPRPDTRVLIAQEAQEDASLRGLRLGTETVAEEAPRPWEIYRVPLRSLKAESWMPRSQVYVRLMERMRASDMPTVGDLFDVKLGINAGRRKAFVLCLRDLEALPRRERRYFRPVAGNATIREGRISTDTFIFFPYGASGPSFRDEGELREAAPEYYSRWLEPAKGELLRRSRVDESHWWHLTHQRGWLVEPSPKLVSAYFGGSGRFAYDDQGTFVVLQGHAWLWKSRSGGSMDQAAFHRTKLPWAYLALLNSQAFESVLSLILPRVQGGQFDLSKRFVDRVFIPDLSDDETFTAGDIDELAAFGRLIHGGKEIDYRGLTECAKRLYGRRLPGL
jgi:hypothetical protein